MINEEGSEKISRDIDVNNRREEEEDDMMIMILIFFQ